MASGLERLSKTLAAVSPNASDYVGVLHLSVSPDGSHIAAGLSSGQVSVMECTSGKQISSCPGTTYKSPQTGSPIVLPVQSMCWASSETLLLVRGRVDEQERVVGEYSLTAVEAKTGRVVASLGHKERISAVAASADGALLAMALGRIIHFYDMRAGLAALTAPLAVYDESHSELVSQLAFHPSLPHYLLSGGDDGLVCIFDTRISGEQDAIVSVLSVGCSLARFGTFGPHAAFAYALDTTGGLSLWNCGSAERMGDFPALSMRLSEAGLPGTYLVDCLYNEASNALYVLAGDDAGRLVWCAVTPTDVKPVAPLTGGHTSTVRAAAGVLVQVGTAAGGLVVFTGAEDGSVQQWGEAGLKAVLGAGGHGSKGGKASGVEVRPSGWAKRGGAQSSVQAVAGQGQGLDFVSAFGKQAPNLPPI